ncbi:MAG: hypothetical protein C0507_25345, partial [Cyanobacteria bacterium PR.3.49]|nr:hypothetical protein [Cyanobacteria bacterium PR.3.49]
MLQDLKLRQKGILMVAVPLLTEIIFVAVLVFLQQSAEAEAQKAFKSKIIIGQTQSVVRLIWECGTNFTLWGFTHSPSFEQRMMQQIREVPFELAELKQMVKNNPRQAKNVAEFERATLLARDSVFHYKERMESGEHYLMTHEAREMVTNHLRAIVTDASAIHKEEMNFQEAHPEKTQEWRTAVQVWLFMGLIVQILITVRLASFFTRNITDRLATIHGNAQLLAEHQPLRRPVEGNDEISALDTMFHKMAITLEVVSQREKAIIDNAKDVICSLSEDAVFKQMSPAAKSNWGYDPVDLLARKFTDFVAEQDRDRLERVLSEAKQQKETALTVDVRIIRNDLSEGWMLWSIYWSPPDESYYCVAHDISDRKELDQMKADFVNMVSHDLRTPLTGMRAFLDSLGAGVYGDLNKKGLNAATRIQNSLGRLVNLVNDLLDVEKMEAGRMEMRFGTYALKHLVDASLDMVRAFAEEQKVNIVVEEIVEADVLADLDRMVQVLQNLLANAIKFSSKGGEISISSSVEPGFIKVEVTDHGAGIAE